MQVRERQYERRATAPVLLPDTRPPDLEVAVRADGGTEGHRQLLLLVRRGMELAGKWSAEGMPVLPLSLIWGFVNFLIIYSYF